MIVVTGYVRIAPEDVETLRPHAQRMIAETRKEGGCYVYAFSEDILDPGLIWIVERWSDWAALNAHFESPHMATWRDALAGLAIVERNLMAHETSEERVI